MKGAESPVIAARIARLEKRLGLRVIVRGMRTTDPGLRGRLRRVPGAVVVEWRDETAGYFWHYDILEQLLGHLERGCVSLTLRDGEAPSVDVPAQTLRN